MKRYSGCDKWPKVLPGRMEASKREVILLSRLLKGEVALELNYGG